MPLKGYTLVESRAKLHNHDPRRVFRVEWLSSRGPSTLLIRSERNDLEFQYVVGSRIGETSQGALATRRFFPALYCLNSCDAAVNPSAIALGEFNSR